MSDRSNNSEKIVHIRLELHPKNTDDAKLIKKINEFKKKHGITTTTKAVKKML